MSRHAEPLSFVPRRQSADEQIIRVATAASPLLPTTVQLAPPAPAASTHLLSSSSRCTSSGRPTVPLSPGSAPARCSRTLGTGSQASARAASSRCACVVELGRVAGSWAGQGS